jgi:glycosyltransferase involved in cell wall biosynthesis
MTPTSATSFAVIITTYRRPTLALRALKSVLEQQYMQPLVIIVNDSPDEDYAALETYTAQNKSAIYLRNAENLGKNASVNRAFDHLLSIQFSGYVIFLDDDDWLELHSLQAFSEAIEVTGNNGWFVANRTLENGTSLTQNRNGSSAISYYRDYLLSRRFSGDATHCILFSETQQCRFPASTKNGEEWFYFAQVAKHFPTFTYLPITGTWSGGYESSGLTQKKSTLHEKFSLYQTLGKELTAKRLWNFPIATYMCLRFLRILIPKSQTTPVS